MKNFVSFVASVLWAIVTWLFLFFVAQGILFQINAPFEYFLNWWVIPTISAFVAIRFTSNLFYNVNKKSLIIVFCCLFLTCTLGGALYLHFYIFVGFEVQLTEVLSLSGIVLGSCLGAYLAYKSPHKKLL